MIIKKQNSTFHFIIKEIFRRDWMFKLVGDDIFTLDDMKCVIRVS